ncbi:MAG: alpha/beta hydrolase, partial [Chloroflexi bacterium]|nr:alpha/beta hydrolase [Chloroflexota bacterium]
HPERVTALVTIGGQPTTLSYEPWELVGLQMSLPLLAAMPYDLFKTISAQNTAYAPEVQAYAREAMDQVAYGEFLVIWAAVGRALNDDPDHQITHPLLITHGEHDNTGRIRAQTPAWAARDTGGAFTIIPDAGHNANQDNPAFFNRALLGFLDGVIE